MLAPTDVCFLFYRLLMEHLCLRLPRGGFKQVYKSDNVFLFFFQLADVEKSMYYLCWLLICILQKACLVKLMS